ncbi:hypothetical protein TVAG_143250 [Trichomonas vaginalis G3]|uniref:Uncharacterized protein n=1 Tax=Trichomonas vaginalis (strain ATCC PRA-98 / G3) TaxID=412133 RepID=A2EWC1_TRIV3|nr:hypothetical protein TVAGG3_0353250 [Trichomonas vaginalis G3]EAY03025.1 hypothetical protein TVAG_143250 [Trichomonas vaginalis G3]KAI5531448.1 hypothetical protein TVAGG3_0353250 [Trichomonas vaginalis G3]|eukprot:XP_001315248.1 hypothetical protein [Trichomonas vaginalis G3]
MSERPVRTSRVITFTRRQTSRQIPTSPAFPAIPTVFRDMLSISDDRIEVLRKNIKECSRILVLNRYYASLGKSNMIPKNDIFLSRLFSPTIAFSFLGITNMYQSSTTLLTFLLKNPKIFSRAIALYSNDVDFNHLVSSIIPSVFGFYYSNEMIGFASKFYEKSVKMNNVNSAMQIILPFFYSGLSSMFFNNLFDRLLPLVSAEIYIVDNNSTSLLAVEYAHTFIRLCGECLPYLHNFLIRILKLILELKWEDSQFIELFFNRFIVKFTNIWALKFKLKQKRNFITEIMNFVPSCKSELFKLKQDILVANGTLFVPDFYQGNDKNPFQNLVCVQDMNLLAKIINQANALPQEIQRSDFDYPEKKKFQWFYVDIYIPSQNIEEPVLFGNNDDVGNLFDSIITKRRWINDLSDWYNKLLKFEANSTIEQMYKIVLSIPSSEIITAHSAFYHFENNFHDDALKQEFFLVNSRLVISRLPERALRLLFELSSRFNQYVNKYDHIPTFSDFHNSLRHHSTRLSISHCISLMESIGELTLPAQFPVFSSVLSDLDELSELENTGDIAYFILLSNTTSPAFLGSFTLLYAFVINVQTLAKILGAKELALWQRLDGIIITALSVDFHYLNSYLEIRKTLCEIASINYGLEFKKSDSAPSLSYSSTILL